MNTTTTAALFAQLRARCDAEPALFSRYLDAAIQSLCAEAARGGLSITRGEVLLLVQRGNEVILNRLFASMTLAMRVRDELAATMQAGPAVLH